MKRRFFIIGCSVFVATRDAALCSNVVPKFTLFFKMRDDWGEVERAAAKEFFERWNKLLEEGKEFKADKPTEEEKNKAKKWRDRIHGNINTKKQVMVDPVGDCDKKKPPVWDAGHIPDVIAGGDPEGSCDWMPLPKSVNRSIGVQMQNQVRATSDDPEKQMICNYDCVAPTADSGELEDTEQVMPADYTNGWVKGRGGNGGAGINPPPARVQKNGGKLKNIRPER